MTDYLDSLSDRSREVFRLIVENYLNSGQPISSNNVARQYAVQLSSASVRNVMSHLEELGLLFSPHTSSGRIPTNRGLRFFVDSIMQASSFLPADRDVLEQQLSKSNINRTTDDMLEEFSGVLSELSKGAALVLTHKQNMRIKHVEFILIEKGRALVILVAEDDTVENRIIDFKDDLTPSQLQVASNWLNAHLSGKTIAESKEQVKFIEKQTMHELDQLTQELIKQGLAAWGGSQEYPRLIVKGHSQLINDVSVKQDIERVRSLLADLETKKNITELLGLTEEAEGVKVFIGGENSLFSLSGSSLITAPIYEEGKRIFGVLGIIGPTRINYAQVVPMVDYSAQLVSRLLQSKGRISSSLK